MLGFRVWDSERKLMVSRYSKDSFMINMKGVMYDGEPGDEDNSDEPLTVSEERFIPMQSAGLKDIHGKEIFEGDILDIESGFWFLSNYPVKNVIDFLIEYGKDEAGDTPRFTIKGNVYESPGLLDKKNE